MVLAHERLKAMHTCQICGGGIERRRLLLSRFVSLTPDGERQLVQTSSAPPHLLDMLPFASFLGACIDGGHSARKSKAAKSAAA